MTNWIPVFCHKCGHEDDADGGMLDDGYVLRCPECDTPMVPTPPETVDDDDDG